MTNVRPLVAALIGLALAACTQSPPDYLEPPTMTSAAPVAVPAAPGADDATVSPLPEGSVRIDPLPSCESGQVTTLHWAEEAVVQGPIRFWIDGDPPALFAESASAGSKQTGAWAHYGQRFFVTDASGNTLARLVVESETPCE